MLSGCINEHVYNGLNIKHLANRRLRTDDEKAAWKVKAADRKAQRAAAREEPESEAESVEDGGSKKGKRAVKPARIRLNRPDTKSRASDLLEDVLGRGGGGLLDFIEKVSCSLSIWSPQG